MDLAPGPKSAIGFESVQSRREGASAAYRGLGVIYNHRGGGERQEGVGGRELFHVPLQLRTPPPPITATTHTQPSILA